MDKEGVYIFIKVFCGTMAALLAMYVAVSKPEWTLPVLTTILGVGGLILISFGYIDQTQRDIVKEIREMQNLADNTP